MPHTPRTRRRWHAPSLHSLSAVAAAALALPAWLACLAAAQDAAAAAAGAGASPTGGGSNSSEPYDGYAALCVVARDENRYIAEWVDYHKCLGFSRIYLYDHGSKVPLATELAGHVGSGFVVPLPVGAAVNHTRFKEGYTSDLERFMATVQGQSYRECAQRFGPRHTFLGFIDVDEFLVIHDPAVSSVEQLLRRYEAHPGVSFYWVLLGSSGHVARPAAPVVDAYTACTPPNHKFNTQFKTFANTRFKPTMYSPHRAVFAAPPDPATGLEPYMVDEHRRRIARGRNKNSTHDVAAVYHYVIKSAADFADKMGRGGGAGVTRPRYYFKLMDRYAKATCDGAQRTRERFCGRGAGAR